MAVTGRIWTAKQVYITALVVSFGASALVVLAMAALGEYTETRGRLLLTALISGGFSVTGLGAATLYDRGRYWPLPAAGMLTSLLGLAMVATGIWATPDSDGYWKATSIISIWAVSLAQVSLLLRAESQRPLARSVRYAAIGAASLLVLILGVAIILEVKSSVFWWSVVLLILAAWAASIAAPVLAWWSPGDAHRDR